MTITIDPALDASLLERAELAGLSVSAYIERLVRAHQSAIEEFEMLALEGLNSGEPIEVGAAYWDAKHQLLDQRLHNTPVR